MTTKIVWVSRHPLTMPNIQILRKAFGDDITIFQIAKTMTEDNIPEIVNMIGTDAKYVVVLPPNLIQAFIDAGAEVYRFVVERKTLPDGRVDLTPIGLEKVIRIVYETERVV